MSEADFCGMDAGEYYATKGFLDRERFYRKQEMEEQMKNRVTVRHGMLSDLKTYLKQSGWKLEEPVGAYEVLRARNPNYPRPLLVHDRAERGVGYSIDERDVKVYNATAASVASTQTGLHRKSEADILKGEMECELQHQTWRHLLCPQVRHSGRKRGTYGASRRGCFLRRREPLLRNRAGGLLHYAAEEQSADPR